MDDQHQFDDEFDDDDEHAPPSRLRIDKWLLAARFFKTKVLATQACDGGKVTVNGERVKPTREITIGERITVQVGEFEWEVDVTHLTVQRGVGPMEGDILFEETDDSRDRRAIVIANRTTNHSSGPAWARPGGGVSAANLPGGRSGGGGGGGRGRERERERERERDRDRDRPRRAAPPKQQGGRGPRGAPGGAPTGAGAPVAAVSNVEAGPLQGVPAAGSGGPESRVPGGTGAPQGDPNRKPRRRRRGRSGRARVPGGAVPGNAGSGGDSGGNADTGHSGGGNNGGGSGGGGGTSGGGGSSEGA